MAKERRYYYECVYQCDVGHIGQDQRRERFIRRGRSEIAKPTMHSVRVYPSRGVNARGEEIPADYIVTDQPIGKNYTEEVEKKVSRPDFEHPGVRNRLMRAKVSKVKFVLRDAADVPEECRRKAYDYGRPQFGEDEKGNRVQIAGWHASLFETHVEDVVLPAESAAMAAAGRKMLAKGA